MADVLNMQQTEYDEVQTRLENLHEDILADARDIMDKIRIVCEKEGGFYVDQISAKINALLDSIEGQVLAELEVNYEAEKTAMETFITSIKGIDVA